MRVYWLFFLAMMQPALAATPTDSMLGDWDLGADSTTALRISYKDSQSIFAQFCDRDLLLGQHICRADVILYFTFSPSTGLFVHDDSTAQHLHATLQIDATDPTLIHYCFRSDVGTGTLNGRKIKPTPGTDT